VPTIRISDSNYQRLQQFAVPLEDTADDAIGRVLDLAQHAKQHGLSPQTNRLLNKPAAVERLDSKLAVKLPPIAALAKEGSTMIRWEYTKTGDRFWVTKSGPPRVYLPPLGKWPSDTDHKVLHHPFPKSGWDRYDHFYLRDESDIDYAIRILKDLELPRG
jgi:hypothetical protein